MASNLDFAEDIEAAKAYMAEKNVFQLFEVRADNPVEKIVFLFAIKHNQLRQILLYKICITLFLRPAFDSQVLPWRLVKKTKSKECFIQYPMTVMTDAVI